MLENHVNFSTFYKTFWVIMIQFNGICNVLIKQLGYGKVPEKTGKQCEAQEISFHLVDGARAKLRGGMSYPCL